MWKIEKHPNGSYKFRDDNGNIVGSFMDSDVMAHHAVFSIQERQRLLTLVVSIEKRLRGAECVPAVVDVLQMIDDAKPKYEEIKIN